MKNLQEKFNNVHNIKLSHLPVGKVSLIIPDEYIDRKTGRVDLDAFWVYLNIAPNAQTVIEYNRE